MHIYFLILLKNKKKRVKKRTKYIFFKKLKTLFFFSLFEILLFLYLYDFLRELKKINMHLKLHDMDMANLIIKKILSVLFKTS